MERGSETASNAMNHSPDYRTGSLEAATATTAAAGLHGCRYEAIRDRIRRDFQCGRDHTNLKQLPSFHALAPGL